MDKLVRIGGEEFLVILPNTDTQGAVEVTKRLLETVYDLNIKHAASEFERVTLSAGLSTKQADDDKTIEYVMLEADKHLYMAKTSGRNCVKPEGVTTTGNESPIKATKRRISV